MAFTQYVQWEVRNGGSASNGGGFDPTSGTPGTDYSQQDAAQVAFTDLVIDGTTNTDCTSALNPFTSAHVGNIVNITGGTGFTVQRVQIMSVTAGVARMDKSLGTLSSTGGTGNLGGGLATIGTAGGLAVPGNTIWVKYHASAYVSSSTTSNVAGGRLTLATGTATAPAVLRGYDVTHGDETGNRPTLQWGVNASNNVLVNGQGYALVENIIVDGNRANYTQTGGVATNGGQNNLIRNCKIINCSTWGAAIGQTTTFQNCEFGNFSASGTISNSGSKYIGCYFHDFVGVSVIGNINTADTSFMDCIFDTIGADAVVCAGNVITAFYNCTFYNVTGDGIYASAAPKNLTISNCIFETCSGEGVSLAALYYHVYMTGCAFYNNGAKYNSAYIPSGNIAHEVVYTSSAFTDGPGADFSLNGTTGGGADLKQLAYPVAFGSATANKRDIGAVQSVGAGSGSSVTYTVGPGFLGSRSL